MHWTPARTREGQDRQCVSCRMKTRRLLQIRLLTYSSTPLSTWVVPLQKEELRTSTILIISWNTLVSFYLLQASLRNRLSGNVPMESYTGLCVFTRQLPPKLIRYFVVMLQSSRCTSPQQELQCSLVQPSTQMSSTSLQETQPCPSCRTEEAATGSTCCWCALT